MKSIYLYINNSKLDLFMKTQRISIDLLRSNKMGKWECKNNINVYCFAKGHIMVYFIIHCLPVKLGGVIRSN